MGPSANFSVGMLRRMCIKAFFPGLRFYVLGWDLENLTMVLSSACGNYTGTWPPNSALKLGLDCPNTAITCQFENILTP